MELVNFWTELSVGRKEGRFTHSSQPARLIGWNSVWVGQRDIQTSTVDSSRLESDHFPLCVTLQCSLAPQPGAVPGADGTPLPRLSWDDSHREAYVQALDTSYKDWMRTQAVGLGPIDNAAVEDGCVQSAEWFPDCYWAMITGVRLIS